MHKEKFRIYQKDNKQMIDRLIYPKFTAEITFNSEISDLENIQVDEDIFLSADAGQLALSVWQRIRVSMTLGNSYSYFLRNSSTNFLFCGLSMSGL